MWPYNTMAIWELHGKKVARTEREKENKKLPDLAPAVGYGVSGRKRIWDLASRRL